MSDFWKYFYSKKTGIKYAVIFHDNKSCLIYNKINSKFLIFKYTESLEIINISNNPST